MVRVGSKTESKQTKWSHLHFKCQQSQKRARRELSIEAPVLFVFVVVWATPFWNYFRYTMGLSKWAYVLMLLGARVLTVEAGTSKYEMGVWQERTVGMGWRYWYELIISKMCMCIAYMCAHMLSMWVHILCVNMYMCMGVLWVYFSSTQVLVSNNILPWKVTRVPWKNGWF